MYLLLLNWESQILHIQAHSCRGRGGKARPIERYKLY